MRVAVIDDEPLARCGVVQRLARHSDLSLAGDYADAEAARAGLTAAPVDLVFVDVQMPGQSGLDWLAAQAPPRRPLAILLTAHAQYAVQAFALEAVDYLLKPIDDTRFDEAVERARRRRREREGIGATVPAIAPLRRFAVRVGRRAVYVEAERIEWIQADGDYALLHVGGRSHLLREPLHRLAERLDPLRFVRVHRSAIVRVDCVAELQALPNRDAIARLQDGTPLRVSRTYIDALLARLQDGAGMG